MTSATAPLTQEFQKRAIRELEEELALWDAVEANREYKRRNPDEQLERHESGAEFLKAMEEDS